MIEAKKMSMAPDGPNGMLLKEYVLCVSDMRNFLEKIKEKHNNVSRAKTTNILRLLNDIEMTLLQLDSLYGLIEKMTNLNEKWQNKVSPDGKESIKVYMLRIICHWIIEWLRTKNAFQEYLNDNFIVLVHDSALEYYNNTEPLPHLKEDVKILKVIKLFIKNITNSGCIIAISLLREQHKTLNDLLTPNCIQLENDILKEKEQKMQTYMNIIELFKNPSNYYTLEVTDTSGEKMPTKMNLFPNEIMKTTRNYWPFIDTLLICGLKDLCKRNIFEKSPFISGDTTPSKLHLLKDDPMISAEGKEEIWSISEDLITLIIATAWIITKNRATSEHTAALFFVVIEQAQYRAVQNCQVKIPIGQTIPSVCKDSFPLFTSIMKSSNSICKKIYFLQFCSIVESKSIDAFTHLVLLMIVEAEKKFKGYNIKTDLSREASMISEGLMSIISESYGEEKDKTFIDGTINSFDLFGLISEETKSDCDNEETKKESMHSFLNTIANLCKDEKISSLLNFDEPNLLDEALNLPPPSASSTSSCSSFEELEKGKKADSSGIFGVESAETKALNESLAIECHKSYLDDIIKYYKAYLFEKQTIKNTLSQILKVAKENYGVDY